MKFRVEVVCISDAGQEHRNDLAGCGKMVSRPSAELFLNLSIGIRKCAPP